MAAAGDRHWWYVATRQLLEQLVVPHLTPPTPQTRYLDAAGGSGATGRWLAARATTLVDDVDEDSVRYASEAGYRPVVADLNALHPDESSMRCCVTALCHRMNVIRRTVREMLVTKPAGRVAGAGVRRLRRGHDRVTHARDSAERSRRSPAAPARRRAGDSAFRCPGGSPGLERGRRRAMSVATSQGSAGCFGVARGRCRRADPTGLSVIRSSTGCSDFTRANGDRTASRVAASAISRMPSPRPIGSLRRPASVRHARRRRP